MESLDLGQILTRARAVIKNDYTPGPVDACLGAISGKEHFCKGTGIVRLHLSNGASADEDVLVVDSTLLGFPFILGMNGIVSLGGATVNVERLVRFGKGDTAVCAAAATVIGVDEQDFSATYDAATNSWTAMWKCSQGVEPGVLQNQIEEYSVPREARLV
ncbi:hypothetical protein GWK47_020461 [Chionoecetes opilio]|uniref:Uncharacterized protein n=1 Tax=Chionoecetes opilio TaxID=41210 RepID=A0A8J4XTS1_CHIOP|nr:hypothetical protein GWK47_020461 [Chionoecetes opilio]